MGKFWGCPGKINFERQNKFLFVLAFFILLSEISYAQTYSCYVSGFSGSGYYNAVQTYTIRALWKYVRWDWRFAPLGRKVIFSKELDIEF